MHASTDTSLYLGIVRITSKLVLQVRTIEVIRALEHLRQLLRRVFFHRLAFGYACKEMNYFEDGRVEVQHFLLDTHGHVLL